VIHTRAVLIDMPRLNRAILRSQLEDTELEVVGEYPGDAVMSAVVRDDRADLVIASDDLASDMIGKLLELYPRLKAVLIAADGRTGAFYELRPRRTDLAELSFKRLLAAVRSADEGWALWTS